MAQWTWHTGIYFRQPACPLFLPLSFLASWRVCLLSCIFPTRQMCPPPPRSKCVHCLGGWPWDKAVSGKHISSSSFRCWPTNVTFIQTAIPGQTSFLMCWCILKSNGENIEMSENVMNSRQERASPAPKTLGVDPVRKAWSTAPPKQRVSHLPRGPKVWGTDPQGCPEFVASLPSVHFHVEVGPTGDLHNCQSTSLWLVLSLKDQLAEL